MQPKEHQWKCYCYGNYTKYSNLIVFYGKEKHHVKEQDENNIPLYFVNLGNFVGKIFKNLM